MNTAGQCPTCDGAPVSKWIPTTDLMMLRRMGKLTEELGELQAVAARCIKLQQGARATQQQRPRKQLTESQKKMWALWQGLADRKLVDSRTMPALLAFVERQTGVARLEWLTWPQENLVIESLKAWLKRGAA